MWVDIEDDEEAIGSVDIDDFPTLLIARGDDVMHYGPVMARRDAALRAVQRALRGESDRIADARIEELARRIRALADARAAMRSTAAQACTALRCMSAGTWPHIQ